MLPLLLLAASTGAPVALRGAAPVFKAVPFGLGEVTLTSGSRLFLQAEANTNWLLGLDQSRLMCLHTSAANLTCSTTGQPYKCIVSAKQPACTPYAHYGFFGHFLGHYLSAAAMAYESTGNAAVKARADSIMTTMAKVQAAFDAAGQVGFIFPYDVRSFQTLYAEAATGPGGDNPHNCAPVCVPFYVLHKMFAGLLDQHTRAGHPQALAMATKMGDWVTSSVEGAIAQYGIAKWQGVLNTEWGGMNEALYNLYALTGNATYLKTGLRFNHWQWTAPLAIGEDDLDGSHGNYGGNHANTHLPEIIGSARGWELTGNSTQKAIATNFFNILTAGENKTWDPRLPGGHSFATGGSNAAEHWFAHSNLADSLQPNRWGNYRNIGARTEESCTQYNALKVARHLYTWSADAKMADYFERAFLNGILGNQNVANDTTVDLEYMLPFGDTAQMKPFAPVGAYNNKFPCCWGTLAEQFAKLQDSIYFKTPDNSTLFVNLFESSTVQWNGVAVEQAATFPVDEAHTTTLTVTVAAGAADDVAAGERTIALRVPWWATNAAGNSVVVNGGPPVAASEITPSTYLLITRTWKSGDTVVVHFPMSLSFEHVDDPRPAFAGYGAVLYGPLLLAGLTDKALFIMGNSSLSEVVVRNSTTELSFEATSSSACGASGSRKFHMLAFNNIRDEHASAVFTAYWFTQEKAYTNTTQAGVPSVLLAGPGDFILADGATIVAAGIEADDAAPQESQANTGNVGGGTAAAQDEYEYDPLTGNHYGNHAHGHGHGGHGGHGHEHADYSAGPVTENDRLAAAQAAGTVLNIRSGEPGQHSKATMANPFKGDGKITAITLEYQFLIGFGTTTPNTTGTSIGLSYVSDLDCPNSGNSTDLYTSPRFLLPSYNKCRTCYSDPVKVHLTNLALDAKAVGALEFRFDNGQHNMQLLLPIKISLDWA